jgi:hypothetical protein
VWGLETMQCYRITNKGKSVGVGEERGRCNIVSGEWESSWLCGEASILMLSNPEAHEPVNQDAQDDSGIALKHVETRSRVFHNRP